MASAGNHRNREDEAPKRIWPVFIKTADILYDKQKGWITTREICKSVEEITGYNTMYAAQRCGGLWRLYPSTEEARMTLLAQGLSLRNVTVTLYDKNPFILEDISDMEEQQTTRLVIGQIPLSYSSEDIEKAVKATGVKMVSKMKDEHDRDEKGQLTRWKTGNRFAYIVLPDQPLPKKLKIGNFTASLYHREQKLAEKKEKIRCNRCLEVGHFARECEGPMRCRSCNGENHKASDPDCPMSIPEAEPDDDDDEQSVHPWTLGSTVEQNTEIPVSTSSEPGESLSLVTPVQRKRAAIASTGGAGGSTTATGSTSRNNTVHSQRRIDVMLREARTESEGGRKNVHSPPTPPERENRRQRRGSEGDT